MRYSLELWASATATRVSLAKSQDFEKTFRVIQRYGIYASPRAIERTTALLGRPPRSYRDYVAEQAQRGVVAAA